MEIDHKISLKSKRYPPQASGLKKCAIILLIIHLVLIFLFIVDHVRIISNEEAKEFYVAVSTLVHKEQNDKDPTSVEIADMESQFTGQHIGHIIVYLFCVVINGLVLKGVFGANRGLIMFGAIMSILGCLSACSGSYVYRVHWELPLACFQYGFGPVYGASYILTAIIDGIEIVLLFMLHNSIGAGGMGGAGMA